MKLVFHFNRPLAQFSLGELSVPNGNAAFRAESVGFDLAADFLYSIVIPVDLMTFQTRDIGNASKKLAGAALGSAVDTVFPHRVYFGTDGWYTQATTTRPESRI